MDETPKARKRWPPVALSAGDAAKLIAACGDDWFGRRHAALLAVYYRAGLRANEALALTTDDLIQRKSLVVRVSVPKGFARGAPQREIGLDWKAEMLMRKWLEVRGDAPGFLFCTKAGGRVDHGYVRNVLYKLRDKAGIRGRVHLHGLRHTFARELYEEGAGIRVIQLALGHSNLSVTDTYLQSIGATEVIEKTAKREW